MVAQNVVAVLFSTGKNTGITSGNDEARNLSPGPFPGPQLFVSHEPRPANLANGEFDDIVIWISPYTLLNRLSAAGAL